MCAGKVHFAAQESKACVGAHYCILSQTQMGVFCGLPHSDKKIALLEVVWRHREWSTGAHMSNIHTVIHSHIHTFTQSHISWFSNFWHDQIFGVLRFLTGSDFWYMSKFLTWSDFWCSQIWTWSRFLVSQKVTSSDFGNTMFRDHDHKDMIASSSKKIKM